MTPASCHMTSPAGPGIKQARFVRVMPDLAQLRTDSAAEARHVLEGMGCSGIRPMLPDTRMDLEARCTAFEKSNLFELHTLSDIEIDIECGRHLICYSPQGAVTYCYQHESLALAGEQGAILSPHTQGYLRCSAGSTLMGVTIAEGDFRREAVAVLQGSSAARLGVTRQFDISSETGRIFIDALHMLQVDLDNVQASRNNKSVRLMFDRLIVYSLLHLVGADTAEQARSGKASLAPRHIKRAEEYIKTHLAEPLDNDLLARVAQVSPRSLYRGFIHFRGVTPARYVQDLRLEEAHRLLTAENRMGDIRTIAAQAGFRSYASFWRSYVRKFGAPPSRSRPGRKAPGEDLSRS